MVYIGYSMLLLEVLQLLCENKIDFVMKRYGEKLTDKVLDKLGWDESDREYALGHVKEVILRDLIDDIDPSEKYLEWITKQFIAGLFQIGQDESQIKEDLEEFEKNKRKMQYQDINRYNLNTLRQELVKFDTSGNEGDFGAEIQKAIENKDVALIEQCGGFVIYQALTKAGAILLGKGGGHKFNRWCTARTDEQNQFDYYNEEENSDIYVAIFENGKRFQFDINQTNYQVQNCMDELDSDLLDGISPDSHYWPIIRKSNFLQKQYRKSMSHRWAFNSAMVTWNEYVEDCVKNNMKIMPSLSIILQMDWRNVEDYIISFTNNVIKLSDSNFLEDLETLGVLYKRKLSDDVKQQVDNDVVSNEQITDRVASIFKPGSEHEYGIESYGEFVQRLYAIGNKNRRVK